jgi:hypothetical protein
MTSPIPVVVGPTRRPRRARVYSAGHWRARLAAFLDRVSSWLNPPTKGAP